MSQREHFIWKLKKINIPEGLNLEEYCESIVKENWFEDEKLEDQTFKEFIQENFEFYFKDKYFVTDNEIFEVITCEEVEEELNFFKANKTKEGIIEFDVQYWNGGRSLFESIEDALNNNNIL